MRSKRSRLISNLDKVTSSIVRLSACNSKWEITCYTCDKKIPRKKAHCAHFVSRGVIEYRFDLDNLRACCAGCNNYNKQRHQQVYTLKLTKEYWLAKVEEMLASKYRTYKMKIHELEDLLIERKEILKNIINNIKFDL